MADKLCDCGRAPEGLALASPLGYCRDCGRQVCMWCGCTWGGSYGSCLCDECAGKRLDEQRERQERRQAAGGVR